jgi:hypothetical protein
MGHPRQALRGRNVLRWEPRQQGNAGIAVPVQEERPSTCQHVHQRLSRCLRRLKSPPCSGWTRRPSRAGRKQESLRPSGRSVATAGTGRRRSERFWRASRSSAQNRARPTARLHSAGCRLARSAARSASGHSADKREGGVDPGGQLTASGGAFRVDAIRASVRRTLPGSIRPLGAQRQGLQAVASKDFSGQGRIIGGPGGALQRRHLTISELLSDPGSRLTRRAPIAIESSYA